MRSPVFSMAALLAGLISTQLHAENIYGLKPGQPKIQSVSALAFGPDGILFVGDSKTASITAIETGDKSSGAAIKSEVEGLNQQIAKTLNVAADAVRIADLAVNPETKNVYLAVEAKDQSPRIFKLDGKGLSELKLENIPSASIALPNAAEDKEVAAGNRRRNNRASAITDLAFANGQLLVAGLSNDKGASNVWSLKFPFQEADQGTPLEFYHGAHGRSEDYAPIRTFVPFIVNGEPNLLAGFVCTPLVKFPMTKIQGDSKERAKVNGTTLAELGNRNQPLDMIAYKKDGKDYLLLSNSARGVMKITTDNVARDEGITSPIPDGKVSGQTFETIDALAGTIQMDKLGDEHVVVITQTANGPATLKVVALP